MHLVGAAHQALLGIEPDPDQPQELAEQSYPPVSSAAVEYHHNQHHTA